MSLISSPDSNKAGKMDETVSDSNSGKKASTAPPSNIDDPTQVSAIISPNKGETNATLFLRTLSPSQLIDLKKGATISILFREDENSEPRVLFDNFPKRVATTFSSVWRAEFPPLHKRTASSFKSSPPKKSVIILGGNMQTYKDILNWMLSCCSGSGLRICPDPDFRPFTNAYLLRMCANHIGCEHLVEATTVRMQFIANAQIHSEDVRALWLMTPPDEAMKQFIADHVATRFWEKSLRARKVYWTLRQELPGFDKAIKELLAAKARKEQQKAARQTTNGGFDNSGGHRHQARRARQQYQETVDQAVTLEQEQDPGTVTLHAEVVRKGAKGRPSYARLDLGDIGVTREQFCAQK